MEAVKKSGKAGLCLERGQKLFLLFDLLLCLVLIIYGIWSVAAHDHGMRVDGKVTITVVDGTLTADGMDYVILNHDRVERTTDPSYRVEKKGNNGWEELPYVGSPVWHLIGYPLLPGELKSFSVNWSMLYGSLPPGTYRYMKPFDEVYYGVEFVIP